MVRQVRGAIFGSLAIYAALAAGRAAADDACQLKMIASLDFTSTERYAVVVPVTLDGSPTKLLIDTGGVATMLSEDWVRDHKLRRIKLEHGGAFRDFAGNALEWITSLPSIQVGTLHASDVRAIIKPGWLDKDVVGALGPDFLMHYEVELDFAAHKMNLFSQDHCLGQVVYWTHDPAAAIPMKIDGGGHIVVDGALDDQPLDITVDTGARVSAIKMSGATALLGLTANSPGVSKVSDNAATGGNYKYTFKSFALAGMNFANTTVLLAGDANPGRSQRMFLMGGHELSKLHLFISYKEHLLYATAANAH